MLAMGRNLRNRILSTWFKVFVLKKYDLKSRSADILGFKVKFFGFKQLSVLFNEIFISNEYYFKTEKENPYIIDCGSNIGMAVIYFKTLYPRSRIVAFEPGEEAFSCLEENVSNNSLEFIELNNAAVSGEEGEVNFFFDGENLGSLTMSTKEERMPKQKRIVKSVLLSKIINEEVDFLKMDIEGAELEVIEELSREKKLGFIKQMVIEYHHHISKTTDEFSRILKYLEDGGFGYHIESPVVPRPLARGQFQDILICAYKKY